MPKTRSDSKISQLPAHQRETLKRWLDEENVSYQDARERLYQDFGVKVSVGALSTWYAKASFADRFEHAASFADGVAEQLAAEGAERFDAATIAIIKQRAFERAVAKDGNIKELATLAKIIGDTARLALKRQELSLSEAKFREATKTAIEKGLEALYQEIKDNDAARQLFERLKACVMGSVDTAEVGA